MVSSVAEEVAQGTFQVLVDLLRAADEADRRHPEAPPVQGVPGGRDHLGVVGQAEVVVGAEVQTSVAGRNRDQGLLR